MKSYSYKSVLQYTVAGILLGVMLVLNALLLNYRNGFNGPWFQIFNYSPDFIIIILSPLILGLLFCFIGIRWQQLVAFNHQIKNNLSHEQMLSSMADQQLKLLGKVVAQINESVIVADNTGCILWVNEGFTTITGYTLHEIIGKKPEEFLLAPFNESPEQQNEPKLFIGKSMVEELKHFRKNGTAYWALISIKPIHNTTGEVTNYIAIESDITIRKEKEIALESEIAERKALELQLISNKKTLEQVIEIAQFGTWEADALDKSVYLSKELRAIYQLPQGKEVTMEELFSHIHQDDMNNIWMGIQLAAKGDQAEIEYRYMIGNEIRHMVSNIGPRLDEEGNLTGYVGTVKDITHRKLFELALKKSEEEKTAVLNHAQAMICMHDLDGRILYVNPAGEKLSGFSKEELIGTSLKDLISPEFQQYFGGYLAEIIAKKSANGSFQITRKDGGKRAWLYENTICDSKDGKPYIIASAIDITESVKAQNELERQQQFIRQIIDNSPNMIFVMNEQGQIILSNKTFGQYYRYNERDIPPASSLSTGPDDIFLGDIDAILELEEGEIIRLEGSMKSNDGEDATIWFNVIKKCFKEKSGKKYFFVIGMDITGRYHVESDLIAANEMVEHSLKVKDQFISNMSHEIRTPLNAVVGFTDLLADTSLTKEQDEYVQIVKSASQNLLALINNILDLSKIESGNLAMEHLPIDVKQVVKDAVKILDPKAKGKGVKLVSYVSDNIPDKLIGDQLRLSQILFNLVGNAVKFTDVGYVEVSCKMVRGSDEAKRYISFVVKDTGIGVPLEKQDAIFERFTQAAADTERLYGGTGLGLNIARSIVDMHGGTLSMESVPGKGTNFTFILPFKKYTSILDEHNQGSLNRALPSPADNPIKVLLAEDNLVNAMLATQVLEKGGFVVTHVVNGVMAIEAVQKHDYDVVLMDIQMPMMNGIDATKAIRALNGGVARIPIVAMTAHSLYGEMQNCYNAGMTGYVSKPFKPENLYAAILESISLQTTNTKSLHTINNMVTYN